MKRFLPNKHHFLARCYARLIQVHYKTHGSHKHVVLGHTLELGGAIAALLRLEMLGAGLLTGGALLILSVVLFGGDNEHG